MQKNINIQTERQLLAQERKALMNEHKRKARAVQLEAAAKVEQLNIERDRKLVEIARRMDDLEYAYAEQKKAERLEMKKLLEEQTQSTDLQTL